MPEGWRIGGGLGSLAFDFSEPIANEEFSIKFTDYYGNSYSMQLEGGRNAYSFDNLDFVASELTDDQAVSISLMYRLTDVPKVVYLLWTEFYCKDGASEDMLPVPRYSNEAIVTEL